jgi:hypothetical protein
VAELSEKYASPGLRWGLYKHDHPQAKKPTYEVVKGEDLGLPPTFGGESADFTGLFVVCVIDPGDGSPTVSAWKEIPKREKRRSGYEDFARTPEHWRKLCTMALGRTLKEAGYPDDTDDLKALLLWRRRSVELELLANGGPLAEIGSGSAPDNGDLDAAAKTTPMAEHPERADEEPVDAEVVPDEKDSLDSLAWSDEATAQLRPLVAVMTEDQLDAFSEWCHERGQAKWWSLKDKSLKTVVAYATSLRLDRPAA